MISAGYNLLWLDERITVKILEESVNFFDKKSATTGREGPRPPLLWAADLLVDGHMI